LVDSVFGSTLRFAKNPRRCGHVDV
jgi:hypothetical protein